MRCCRRSCSEGLSALPHSGCPQWQHESEHCIPSDVMKWDATLLEKTHPNSNTNAVCQDLVSWGFFGVPWSCWLTYAYMRMHPWCNMPPGSAVFIEIFSSYCWWYLYIRFSWIALLMRPFCSVVSFRLRKASDPKFLVSVYSAPFWH